METRVCSSGLIAVNWPWRTWEEMPAEDPARRALHKNMDRPVVGVSSRVSGCPPASPAKDCRSVSRRRSPFGVDALILDAG